MYRFWGFSNYAGWQFLHTRLYAWTRSSFLHEKGTLEVPYKATVVFALISKDNHILDMSYTSPRL